MRGALLGAVVVIASLLITPQATARPAAAAGACDSAGAPTRTIYLPNITKTLGGPSGWVTPFIVQNVGAGTATLEISFYEFSSGQLVTCRKVTGLAPSTSFADVPNNDEDLPHNSAFSVVVRSFGSDAVAVVNEHQGSGARAESLSYVGLTSGSTRVHLPYVPKNVGGWLTTFAIQNMGTASATVSASFVSADGLRRTTLSRTVLPGRAAVVNPLVEPSLLAGTEYAATLTSTQPIGVVANAHNDAADAPAPMAFSYNGTTAAAPETLYLPHVVKNVAGRSSRIVIQNAGTSDATPTIQLRPRTGAPVTLTAAAAVAPGRTWSPDLRLSADGEYSATVEGGLLGALVITTDATSAFGYTGQRPSASRLFLPNVTRTLGGPLGWSTPLVIQSAGATSAILRWYRFSDGRLMHTQALGGLAAGAGVQIEPATVAALSDNSQYAVVLEAPGPVTALVLEFSRSGGDSAMAYEGFSSTATALPVATSLSIAPQSVSAAQGATVQLAAETRDQFGAVMPGAVATWSVVPPSLGTVTAGGLFTAGETGGTGTIRATSGGLSSSIPLTVRAPTTTTVGGISFRLSATGTADIYVQQTITTADSQAIVAAIDADVPNVQVTYSRSFETRPTIYVTTTTASYTTALQTIFGYSPEQAVSTGKNSAGLFNRRTKWIAVDWEKVGDERPISVFRHELTHRMIDQVARPVGNAIPAWLDEGSARAQERTLPGSEIGALVDRLRVAGRASAGQLYAADELAQRRAWNDRVGIEQEFEYAQAAEMVRLLRSDIGAGGIVRILERVGAGTEFDDAYAQVTGRRLDEFTSSFASRLRRGTTVPGLTTLNESGGQTPGLHFFGIGFRPNALVSVTIVTDGGGFLPSVDTRTADAFGLVWSYLGPRWGAGSYSFTMTSGTVSLAGRGVKAATSFSIAAD